MAMRVGRLLRSSEGVGAESHRVTGSQGRRFEESRGFAESRSQRISQRMSRRQAGSGGGGVALTGWHA